MSKFLKCYFVSGLCIALLSLQTLAGREMIRVNENQNGETISVETGDTLEVMLEGNPTTGYTWEVKWLDPAVIKQAQSDFISGSTGLGSAGSQIFRFEAIASGETVLKLIYKRPFEKSMMPLKDFKVTISVKK